MPVVTEEPVVIAVTEAANVTSAPVASSTGFTDSVGSVSNATSAAVNESSDNELHDGLETTTATGGEITIEEEVTTSIDNESTSEATTTTLPDLVDESENSVSNSDNTTAAADVNAADNATESVNSATDSVSDSVESATVNSGSLSIPLIRPNRTASANNTN